LVIGAKTKTKQQGPEAKSDIFAGLKTKRYAKI
jgi:hypothetical protein